MSTPSLDLPVVAIPADTSRPHSPLEPSEHDRLIRRAKALSWLSLAYMGAEGAVAITAATLAGSVALLGFGLDSAIEALASIIVIWRFTGTRRLSGHAEQRAQRLLAITFFLLAPYITQDAIRTLINGEHPRTSWLGIGLSISSIAVMPPLGKAKQAVGQRLGSGATAGEATQNMLCCGGPTPPSRSPSVRSLSMRAAKPGTASAAAPSRRSPARRSTLAAATAAPDPEDGIGRPHDAPHICGM
jgi:hypothetical protein